MKNKIFLMLILIFTFVLGTSCFAFSENDLYDILEVSTERLNEKENRNLVFDSEDYVYTGSSSWGFSFNSFLNLIDNLDYFTVRFSNYGNQNSPDYGLSITLFNYDNFPIELYNSSFITAEKYSFSYHFNNKQLSISGKNTSTGSVYIYNGDYDLGHNFDFKYNNVLYESNYDIVQPVLLPTIELSSTTYSEYSPINVTINCNNYYEAINNGVPLVSDYYYLRLCKIDSNDNIIYTKLFQQDFTNFYNNGNVFSSENYDSVTDSFNFNLLDYHSFDMADGSRYILELVDYDSNVINDSGYFTVHFSDNYEVNEDGKYNITPVIRVSPEEASTSKTVTISCPVNNSTIYYKVGSNDSWHYYNGAFNVSDNCTIYAHCFDTDGSASALASYTVFNIKSAEAYDNRLTAGPWVKYDRLYDSGKRAVRVFVENIGCDIEYSFDDLNWFNFVSEAYYGIGTFGHSDYHKNFYINSLPFNVYFRYVDSNGFYSPTSSIIITSFENDLGLLNDGNRGNQDSYDNNGNYIPNNNPNSSFSGGFGSFFGSDIYNSDGSINTGAIVSNSIKSGWGFISELPAFFITFKGLFIFIPDEIMIVIFAFLAIKFVIAIIGFLRG